MSATECMLRSQKGNARRVAPCLCLAALVLATLFPGVCDGQDDRRNKKVPHQDDETSLVRIKANPEIAVGKNVVICGGVEIDDYYNFSYANSEKSHYSLKFYEAGATYADIGGESAPLYFSRATGREAIDEIVKNSEANKGANRLKLARVQVLLVAARFQREKQWDNFEVVDIQFYSEAKSKWEPWVVQTARDTEKAKLAVREQEEKARKAEAEKEAAAAAEAAAARKPKKGVEEIAASKLALAKSLLQKNESAARMRLQEIVDQYPDTKSAQDALKMLGRKP